MYLRTSSSTILGAQQQEEGTSSGPDMCSTRPVCPAHLSEGLPPSGGRKWQPVELVCEEGPVPLCTGHLSWSVVSPVVSRKQLGPVLGCGLCIRGEPVDGVHSSAEELGHL